jgi:hyperosmotically inducible protein
MVTAAIALTIALVTPAPAQETDARTRRVQTEVQHELITLPYYGVFDNLAFVVEKGGTVRLLGQTIRPTLKSDAEKRVKKIPGVDTVINEIEVLPLGGADNDIRLLVYRNIYRTSSLERYGLQVNPSIHIIVKNGRVALEGVVDTEADKTVAGLKAREIGGVFEVKNNLRVER